jgi:hypothetical protein
MPRSKAILNPDNIPTTLTHVPRYVLRHAFIPKIKITFIFTIHNGASKLYLVLSSTETKTWNTINRIPAVISNADSYVPPVFTFRSQTETKLRLRIEIVLSTTLDTYPIESWPK